MAQEVELKLQIAQKDTDAFLALRCIQSKEKKSYDLINTYYDTEDGLLGRHKVALRIRQKGNVIIQTLKTQGENQGGLHVRGEFEHHLNINELDLNLISDELIKYLPIQNVSEIYLKPVFRTDFHRTEIQLENFEVVFDKGEVVYADLKDEICEIEIEIKNQTQSVNAGQVINQLFELAQNIAQEISVMPSDVSKALRGERLKLINNKQSYEVKLEMPSKQDSFSLVTYYLQCIQTNWEAYLFSKQQTYLNDALNVLCKLVQMKFGSEPLIISLQQIKSKWSELLDAPSDDLLNEILQDKSIGLTIIKLSQLCHVKEVK